MKPDKLRNLLQEMDSRVRRLELSAFRNTAEIASRVAELKAEVRRSLAKVDSMRLSDVARLETLVAAIRIPGTHQNLDNLILGLKIGLSQLGPDELLEALPGQKTAAFSFAIGEDALVVADQPFRPSTREYDMAMAAIEAAVEHGEYVVGDLIGTNASPRLKAAFQQLQTTMSSYKNIVQVGSRAQICNRLIHGEMEELSPVMFSLLVGHIESVFSALAQFEDWRIYSENAASVNIDAGSVEKLTVGTTELLKSLRQEPSADISVLDALDVAARWVKEGDKPDKRDVLGLSRSWENLWSAVTKVVLGFGRDIVSEGRTQVAAAVLSVLLLAAPSMVQVIAKTPGGEWVQTVFDYFKKFGVKPPGAQ